VVYPPESLGAPPGVPLLPVPLIEAAFNLVIALALSLCKKYGRLPTGTLTALYLALYAILRFILEFWRGDAIRGIFGGFSTSQYLSAGAFAAGIALLFLSKRAKGGFVLK
jgi:phosphatidylglycerol:prolipoprotein diacylglycerol transferase